MAQLTIGICTYNGQKRLPQVLECLKLQKNCLCLPWEVIVVDNNSSDATAEIIRPYQENWVNHSILRYYFEPQQGLSFARQKAIEEATSPLVAFLDDDNLPSENWLTEAYLFAQSHPKAGAYGGQIGGKLEREPPEDFQKFAVFLAVIDRGADPYIYEPQQKILPPGSGLVVRRQVWLENVPPHLFLSGRLGSSMLAGEDLEALCYLQRAGWEIWYNPRMKMAHQIPAYRLEREYLSNLAKGIGLARHHIRMLRLPVWQRPLLTPVYLVNDLRKVILYFMAHQNQPKTLATVCHLSFLWGSLLSPFYLSKIYWLQAKSGKL